MSVFGSWLPITEPELAKESKGVSSLFKSEFAGDTDVPSSPISGTSESEPWLAEESKDEASSLRSAKGPVIAVTMVAR